MVDRQVAFAGEGHELQARQVVHDLRREGRAFADQAHRVEIGQRLDRLLARTEGSVEDDHLCPRADRIPVGAEGECALVIVTDGDARARQG